MMWDTALLGALFERCHQESEIAANAGSRLSSTLTDVEIDNTEEDQSAASGQMVRIECYRCNRKV